MSEAFIGELRIMSFTFAPRGWAQCTGQLLPINQNQALFSLLGTQYGGNGQTNFALPDLRGRAAVHAGNGPGIGPTQIGERGGVESVTLQQQEMPQHGHTLNAVSDIANAGVPGNALPAAKGRGGVSMFGAAGSANTTLGPQAVTNAGGSQPHTNMQPYGVLNFCIAIQGIFPSRN
jgi:microcystin-dependent protein